jgi:hypothetical protein
MADLSRGTGFTPTTLAGDEAVAFVIDINLPRDPSNETIARIYELYPNDTSLGSPYDTGNETFGLDPQYVMNLPTPNSHQLPGDISLEV